jgi:hypothetical protein
MPDDPRKSRPPHVEAGRLERVRRQVAAAGDMNERQRRLWATGLAIVLLVLAVFGVWVAFRGGPTVISEARPVTSVALRDGSLDLTWQGPACESADPDRTRVTGTADEVVVALYVEVPTDGCDGAAVAHMVMVPVDAPLAGRPVVDAACTEPGFVTDARCEDPQVPVE